MIKVFEKDGNIIMENSYYTLEYSLSAGVFSIKDVRLSNYIIRNAYSSVCFQDDTPELASSDADSVSYSVERHAEYLSDIGCRVVFHIKFTKFTYTLSFFIPETQRYLLAQASVLNESPEQVKIENINIIKVGNKNNGIEGYLSISDDPGTCNVYTNTYYKTPSMVRRLTDGFDCRYLDKNGDIKYFDRDLSLGWQAKYDGLIYDTVSGRSVVFGFVSFYRFMCEIELKYDRSLHGKSIKGFALLNTCSAYLLRPGNECNSETVYINFCGNVHENQMHFADTVGKTMKAKFLKHPMSGWCSWHYRFFDINEEDVLKNAEFVASRKDIFPVVPGGFEYIQIDYGWQKYIGSNEVDASRFPSGMKLVADRIHELGLKAGIWIAPFWIDEGCGLHESNPEYLLHNEEGNLIKVERGFKDMPFYRLDVSNPGAVKYIIEMLDQIINEWGYDMIKMDFLEMATVMPVPDEKKISFYNPCLSSYEHLRNACTAIQNYVDDLNRDIFMSPCGSPTMFLTGIFRTNYVSEDAAVKSLPDSWNEHAGVKSFVRSWGTKYYMNNRIWTNNCESIMLDKRRPLNEALINATAAALTGGIFFSGDELPELPKERLKIYSRILPVYKEAAIPIDIFESQNPVIWKLPVKAYGEEWVIIGVFNLEDFEIDINLESNKLGMISGKEYLMFDFWEQKFIGSFKDSYTMVNVPERTVKLICLREKMMRPQIISTDIHFTQGAVELENVVWNESSQSLEGLLKNCRTGTHKLFLYLPTGYVLKDFHPFDADMEIKDNICVFTLTSAGKDSKKFTVRFDKK